MAKKTIFLSVVLATLVNVAVAADTRPPLVWLGNGLFGARIPADWTATDARDGKSVTLSLPGFSSRVVLVAPNFNIEDDNILEYAVSLLHSVSENLKVTDHEDTQFGGFGALAVSAVAPGDGKALHFLQAYVIDCWFGGAPALVVSGPPDEKDGFMAAISPLLQSFRIDFWEVAEREDELQTWSNTVFASTSEADDTDDAPRAGDKAPKPAPQRGTGRSGGSRR